MTAKNKKLPNLYLPALLCKMGEWDYYATCMSLGDIAERIKFALELKHPERYDEWMQRDIQESRKNKITNYILNQPERFFSSLVVTVYGGKPKWFDLGLIDSDKLSLEELPLIDQGTIDKSLGILLLSGEEDLFPIDGQHRLWGIRAAVKSNPERKDDIISVLFVEDRGLVHTRRLFSRLNRYAVPINTGERILLDEDDGMAITTRRLINHHQLFNKGQVASPKRTSLTEDDETSFTTAVTIYTINKILCIKYEKGKQWGAASLTGTTRPSDEQLDAIYRIVDQFWNLMIESFREVSALKASSLRKGSLKKVVAKNRNKEGGLLLFRPVGQMGFARAVRSLYDRGISFEDAFKSLCKLPYDLAKPPWFKVVWQALPGQPGRMVPTVEAQKVIAGLLIYLGGLMPSKDDRAALLASYKKLLGEAEAELPRISS